VKALREKIPSLALTTDIIVGFPGETEEEFAETLSLCEEVRYSAAFTFIYSPRVGTPAAKMVQVPDEVKHERFDRLKALIEQTTSEHSASMVGKTYEVLVEGPSKKNDDVLSSYASNGKLINFKGPAYLTGCLVNVKVTESHTYSLLGELVDDPILAKAKDVAFLMGKDPLLKEYLRLDEDIRKDPEIAKLGEDLVATKKKMCLDLADKALYEQDKKAYEAVLLKIRSHPLLANREALRSDVETSLLEIRDSLK
jgi:hypothetical protein